MELTPSEVWSRVLSIARDRVPEQSFRTWLEGSEAVGISDDRFLVEAPSEFHAEWIEDKFGAVLEDILETVVGRRLRLSLRCSAPSEIPEMPEVEVDPGPPSTPSPRTDQAGSGHGAGPTDRRRAEPERGQTRGGQTHAGQAHGGHAHGGQPNGSQSHGNLNDRYTFDRFVVGTNNQLAAAASRAVAEKPARIYNPLFLYGGVGLGKTHLMHAVGHAILDRQPDRRVVYVTAEAFMNELVNAIQTGTQSRFRRIYRFIDLLLVDDVHFLERKEATQEEFFHTFNALYDAGKQIVLTSDRPPKELPGVEDRLVSRFEWGLVADIKPPDYETRIAILRKKAADDDLTLDSDVMDFIARYCTASVRELEGAVIKLLAFSSLRKEEITVELARTALQGVLRPETDMDGPALTPEMIRDRTAAEWGVRPEALATKRRTRDLTVPRQVAMYLLKDLLDLSLVRIGALFGGRDHSTVIHSIRKVEQDMETDPSFAARVQRVRRALTGELP
jgi:chromosomal replication initiator protein